MTPFKLMNLALPALLVLASLPASASERAASPWRADVRPASSRAAIAGGWRTTVHRFAAVRTARLAAPADHALEGRASFYWQDQMTASGERFDKQDLTAAHRTLPFGTRVRVRNLDNGRDVVVRINDRGPFLPGRVVDLSDAAAEVIDMKRKGLVPVTLELVP